MFSSWLKVWFPEVPWDSALWGNSLEAYAEAFIVFVVAIVFFKILHAVTLGSLMRLAKRTKTDLDDTILSIMGSLKPPFYIFVAFAVGVGLLEIPEVISKVITTILVIWVVYQVILAVQIFLDRVLKKRFEEEGDVARESAVSTLGTVIKFLLWVLGGLFVLSNLGVEVTSLIAGLGIGGVAVAFALQNILGDLFSSFAIYFDKPFSPGDFIVVGEHSGVVERIGIKTTRIRALRGEEIVISNQELTSSRVQNFKKLQERRVDFTLGVTYDTPEEKIKRIPGMIRDVVEGVDKVRFDRAHFREFGDSALLFEIVFFVESEDYNLYMDVRQEINLGIRRAFETEGIEFAFPSRTVYLEKS